MGATKKAKVTFTCEHDMKDYLTEWAEAENRTLSNLVETLVAEAIATKKQNQLAQGGLTKPAPAKSKSPKSSKK